MNETELYPLVMAPSYRSGAETPWGGGALREKFGKDAPEGITGESLEISALPGHESRAANGPLRGRTVGEIFARWGRDLTGSEAQSFPLLLKLLDAKGFLSVQVHPDDAYALAREGKKGKCEAWYILDAAPGARLVYGVDTRGEDLRAVVESGRLESCLRWVDARPGDVFYIPSGTVHALGPGIQCYEIQESSDVTYRFWDWGRKDAAGRSRELHTEQALAVARPGVPPVSSGTAGKTAPGGAETVLAEDPHFRLSALDLHGRYTLPDGCMRFLTAVAPCVISWGTQSVSVAPYQSVLIPAGLKDVRAEGNGRVLLSCGQRSGKAEG